MRVLNANVTMVDQAIAKEKNPHAVALRKLAGSKFGLARTANLTPKELSEIGRKCGLAGGRARAKNLTKTERKRECPESCPEHGGQRPREK